MLLLVTDAMLSEATRASVVQVLMAGVRDRDADVVLVESVTEVGVSGQSRVLSLLSSESDDILRGPANGAAAVIYVSSTAGAFAMQLLGLRAGAGFQSPFANVVVTDRPVVASRKMRAAGNVLFRKVDPVRTRRRIRVLKKTGRTFGRLAAEPLSLTAAARDVS